MRHTHNTLNQLRLKNKKHDLDHEPIGQLVVKMTLPVMLAGLLTTSYGFVDMIFASRLGGVQVASIAFVTPLFVMLTSLMITKDRDKQKSNFGAWLWGDQWVEMGG